LSGTTGDVLGPYTVKLVGAASAALTVAGDADAKARDCSTNAPLTTATDGQKICLVATKPGSATLSASTTAIVPTGRVFKDIKPGETDRQELILAKSTPVPL